MAFTTEGIDDKMEELRQHTGRAAHNRKRQEEQVEQKMQSIEN